MCAQVSDAEGRKLLGQESQRTRTLEETVMIFQALSGQRMIVRSERQIHHQGSQGRKDVVHVCAHSEELSSDRDAGELEQLRDTIWLQPDVLTGRSVHARLREVPVDYEARRQAAGVAVEKRAPSSDGRCGERSAAAELCSMSFGGTAARRPKQGRARSHPQSGPLRERT